MLRRTVELLFLTVCLILCISCAKAGLDIADVQASGFMSQSGEESFYLYFDFAEEQKLGFSVTVTSPDSRLSWSCPLVRTEVSKHTYYGSSDFTMPLGRELQRGSYKYEILRSDGEIKEGSFEL